MAKRKITPPQRAFIKRRRGDLRIRHHVRSQLPWPFSILRGGRKRR